MTLSMFCMRMFFPQIVEKEQPKVPDQQPSNLEPFQTNTQQPPSCSPSMWPSENGNAVLGQNRCAASDALCLATLLPKNCAQCHKLFNLLICGLPLGNAMDCHPIFHCQSWGHQHWLCSSVWPSISSISCQGFLPCFFVCPPDLHGLSEWV